MKIWCTEDEKERIIRILADKRIICVFGEMVCERDDCGKCIEDNIEWHIFRRKLWKKQSRR